MKKLVVIILAIVMSVAMLIGCTNEAESADNNSTSEVESSQEESKVISEEIVSEEDSVEVSEEVDETDYSGESVMSLADDLIAKYPEENADYIRALVIAMNIDHMESADVETVMTTYGYTFEQLNENFVAILEIKNELCQTRERYMVGDVDTYEPYEDHILLNECCLNPDESIDYEEFENMLSFGSLDETRDYKAEYLLDIEKYKAESKKGYLLCMIGINREVRSQVISGFDSYDNIISQYAANLNS